MKRTLGLTLGLFAATLQAQTHFDRDPQANVLLNAGVDGTANWYAPNPAYYDADVSATADGSGAFKLVTAAVGNNDFDWIVSRTYPVEAGQKYTVSAKMLSDTFPSPAASFLVIFRQADGSWLQNSFASMQSTAAKDDWQEVTTQVWIPEQATSAQVYAFVSRQHHEYPGTVWLDDFYFAPGVSFDNAPSAKTAFDGLHTKVDALGNLQVNVDGQYQSFLPLCIHADNRRPDWTLYSAQGFNCNMWAGSALYVQKAKDAVSDFNPRGMMSGFQIANFMMPSLPDYHDLDLLNQRIDEISAQGLSDSLLLYYWDNEKDQVNEWDVPVAVTDAIRNKNTGHPIYMLMDNEGLTRKYKNEQVNMIDMTGDYINVGRYRDSDGLTTVNNIQHQSAPLTFAQINYGTGNKFRAKIYAGLAKGAKGFSVWRDDYLQLGTLAGPIDQTLWWDELPQIRRELDQLLPLVREPLGDTRSVNMNTDKLDFGIRTYRGKQHLILSNEHDTPVEAQITVSKLRYQPGFAVDFLTQLPITAVSTSGLFIYDATFTVTVDALGSKVISLLPAEDVIGDCCEAPGPTPPAF